MSSGHWAANKSINHKVNKEPMDSDAQLESRQNVREGSVQQKFSSGNVQRLFGRGIFCKGCVWGKLSGKEMSSRNFPVGMSKDYLGGEFLGGMCLKEIVWVGMSSGNIRWETNVCIHMQDQVSMCGSYE